ncbi:MAG: DUF1841 family protein [Burkholderiales bacterium]|nr:DUF1841 family protein [Burkholderiales bacterium]MCJ7837891.1 DUF1841 family protein [Burkholderiales bacterium]
MFNPTRDQVRQFFFDAWRKHREREVLAGMDHLAVDIILMHPEYHRVLDDPERYQEREYRPEAGDTNPFLHMSMHLAIEEQLSIDQPAGLKAEFARLAAKSGDRHAACHEVMECLAEMVWRAQRDSAAPDAVAYLECLKRR